MNNVNHLMNFAMQEAVTQTRTTLKITTTTTRVTLHQGTSKKADDLLPVVEAGIGNSSRVPVIARLLFAKDTVGYYLTSNIQMPAGGTAGLTSISKARQTK